MVSIFEFTSYRKYLCEWIADQGSRSYGLQARMAKAMGMSSSLLSQILKGRKLLTPDQASELTDFIGLTELESEYFHLLVDIDRSGSARFKSKLAQRIKKLQQESRRIGKRVPRHRELTDEQKAIYYSSWLYTGIRNLTALADCGSVSAIAERLHLPQAVVSRVLRFLIENSLCIEANGRVTYGPAAIHIDRESPFVNKHHQNWRVRAIEQMESQSERDLFFTSPMSLSFDAAENIRSLLPEFIQKVMQISAPSTSELTACLNIDWFEY